MRHDGFTIVELLIVIIVIAILAAISIVAYTGIQRKAAETALKSDLTQAGKQLALEQVEQGTYPGTDSTTTNGSPTLTPSPRTTFQYTRTNNGQDYCLTATSSTSGIPAYHISATTQTPTEGTCPGHTGPVTGGGGGGTTIANNSPIQDVTSAQCAALPTFTGTNDDAIRAVTDNRGGTTRTYRIAKLADNKCWMLDNLKLGSTTGTITLTSVDSNVSSNFVLPQLTTSGSADYDNPRAYGPVPGDTGSGATNYGYLYNWSAATAGETRTSITTGNAPHSICANGWRLPIGGHYNSGVGDFADLDRAFGGTGMYQSSSPSVAQWQATGTFKGVLTGGWWEGFGAQGGWGDLWSSSADPSWSDGAFNALFNPGVVNPGGYGPRGLGFGVRCLLN